MRDVCRRFFLFLFSLIPGEDKVETGMETVDVSSVRICANIKSRRHPDRQCEQAASNGDFCFRHWKRPHRYVPLLESQPKRLTRQSVREASRISAWWKKILPLRRFLKQGPASNCVELAHNDTEVYTIESVSKIPLLYFFSYADE
jgi:hypothetical protein